MEMGEKYPQFCITTHFTRHRGNTIGIPITTGATEEERAAQVTKAETENLLAHAPSQPHAGQHPSHTTPPR